MERLVDLSLLPIVEDVKAEIRTPEHAMKGTKSYSTLPSTCQFQNLKDSINKHMEQHHLF